MASNMYGKSPMETMLRCLVGCGLLAGVLYGQVAPAQPTDGRTVSKTEVADAVAKVRSGKFNGYHVGVIGEAGATEAVPDLELQFTRDTEPIEKAQIAQVLLALGDRKDAYWNYLVELAKPALQSDAPNPIQNDAQGKSLPGLSPQFAAWATAHDKSPDEAGETALYIYPGIMMLLGSTRDPRAIPLLRQGLSSPNNLVEAAATKGLAEFQDVPSIPLIIAACKKAPAEGASVIAESLVYFDDPQAQNAVDTYVPKEEAKLLRQGRMRGKGALHR
jgi:HEAT repeat protein